MTLIARCDIQAGKELNITYIDANVDLEARRAALEHNYGFVCRCALCAEEEEHERAEKNKNSPPVAHDRR